MLVGLMAGLFALPLIVCLLYREWNDAAVFAILAVVCLAAGYLFGMRKKPVKVVFYAREGFVITALAWIVLSMIGAVPFTAAGATDNYLDSVFETVSGFTTTGSTIMTDPSILGHGLQFWRCFTHWVGGMGILVFMLAILPMAGGYSMHLMRAESPGPTVGKFAPKVKDTAKLLYGIYIVFTLAEMMLLKLTGLSLYESSIVSFSTVGTGGFGVMASSCATYPLASRIVIIIFMTLCGINFSVYYFLLTKRFKEAWQCDEMRWYLIVMFVSSVVMAWNTIRAGILLDLERLFSILCSQYHRS
jgi:trk system potassium uptake protein TrkH